MKKVRGITYDQVNEAVLKLFTRQRSENFPISGVQIKEYMLHFPKKLNIDR